MKRIFTLSVVALTVSLFFSACSKNNYYSGNDESYWLSKERGEVVYSDTYCSYFVVETNYGYNVVRAYGNYKPFEGDIVYGNFSSRGSRDLYNYTTGVVFSGTITDYWLSYREAQDALDYYCPFGKGTTGTREFKKSNIVIQKK